MDNWWFRFCFIESEFGIYNVIVKDDNNCQANLFIEIPLEDNFILDINSTSLICNDDSSGTATVSCTGGFGPYNYDWNSSDEIIQVLSASNTNTLSSLSQGVTSVVVTDVNGCAKTTQINIDQPNELVYTITKLNMKVALGNIQVVMVFSIYALEVRWL